MGGIVTAAASWKTLKKIDAHILSCYVDLSAILPDYVRVYGIAGTRSLLRRFGADRLLFATDYPDSRLLRPGEIYAAYSGILDQMAFAEEDAAKIAYGNARELLG